MGLDLAAHSQITPIPTPDDPDTAYDDPAAIHTFAYAAFPRSTRGLLNHDKPSNLNNTAVIADGWYKINGKSFRWHGGSYSGYGRFRQHLANISGLNPDTIWQNPHQYYDAPFFELIHFADNEGCIGHLAAADLHTDFVEHRTTFKTMMRFNADADYYLHKYDAWLHGTELAADHGVIDFH